MRSTLSSFDPVCFHPAGFNPIVAGMAGTAQIAALSLHIQTAMTPPAPTGSANDGFLAGLRGLAAREASREASREAHHTHEAAVGTPPLRGQVQTSRSAGGFLSAHPVTGSASAVAASPVAASPVAATRLLVESFAS